MNNIKKNRYYINLLIYEYTTFTQNNYKWIQENKWEKNWS